MIRLPLYLPDELDTPLDVSSKVDPRGLEGSCQRCQLGKQASSPCLADVVEGEGATLLVVVDRPTLEEDRAGLGMLSDAAQTLRDHVERHWRGRVVYTYAVRCGARQGFWAPGNKSAQDKTVDACRPLLASTVDKYKPERILLLGSGAFKVALGRVPEAASVRKGYSFLADGTPVFLLLSLADARRNRFMQRWLMDDVAWAMSCEAPSPDHRDATYLVVETVADSHRAVADLRERAKWIVPDIESAGVFGDAYFEVLSLSLCSGSQVLPTPYVWPREACNDDVVMAPVLELLADASVRKAGQNFKFDIQAIRARWGIDVCGWWCDTLMDRAVLQADAKVGLDTLAELVGMGGIKKYLDRALTVAVKSIGEARSKQRVLGQQCAPMLPGLGEPAVDAAVRLVDAEPRSFAYALVHPLLLARYNARDTFTTARVARVQRMGDINATKLSTPQTVTRPELTLRWSRLRLPADRLLTPAAEAYARIEQWGVPASLPAMRSLTLYLTNELVGITRRLAAEGLTEPTSTPAVQDLVYKRLGFAPDPRSGYSTAKGVLARLIMEEPERAAVLQDLLEHRRISKLLGSYSEGLAQWVRADGRIHPHFKLTGTRTGRPSCEDPNLQVLPRPKSREGKMTRDCFQCAPGRVFVELDYSQIEIRVAAGLSGDERMLAAYREGAESLARGGPDVDLHWRTVLLISKVAWGLEAEVMAAAKDAYERERSASKAITFGLMYGKTVATLARELGIAIEAAQRIVNAILGGYSGFDAWCKAQQAHGRSHGESWTWWDGSSQWRRRPLWEIGDAHDRGRPSPRAQTAMNSTINAPIQGTASDFCLASTIELVKLAHVGELGRDTKVVLTIHDAVVFESHEDDVPHLVKTAKACMLQWPTPAGVPFGVDAKVGRTLGELKGYHA